MALRVSPHPIGITELETGRCLDINDACLEIFGFRRDEVIGQTTLQLGIWPDPQERVRLMERLKSERSVRNLEVSMRMKNGGLCWFLISTDLVKLGGKRCLLTIGNDITERKQADQYHTNDRLVLESGQAPEFEEVARYTDGLHTNIVIKFPVRDEVGRIYATGGIVTDITDRKNAEEELRQSQDELRQHRAQLQDLTYKLIKAQEHERQRIARDLHDDFSRRMAALVLDIAALEQQPSVRPELIPQGLVPMREQLELLADDLHNLAYKLHPSLLLHAGLQPAVEDHIRQVAARTGLRILLKTREMPPALSHDQTICLFRVLQENLQNVVKHAKATEVTVQLSGSSKGIGLSVKDNGHGFNLGEKTAHQKGLGLLSMQERLRLLNGILNIHSRPEDGTKVCAWIPFNEAPS